MKENERGQALILVSLALIGLLAVAGLALDGGQLYRSRRQAQNAADAAALAGARLLLSETCASSGNSDLEISNAIIEFADRNGVTWDGSNILAQYIKVENDGLGTLTVVNSRAQATGISVTLVMTSNTSFMRIVGIDHMTTPASAVAVVGPVTQMAGGSILPIGVPDEILSQMSPGDYMTIENDAVCRDHNPENCIADPDANYGNANSQRGWLNFGYIYNTERYQQNNPSRRTHEVSLNANAIKAVIEVAAGLIPNNPPWWLGDPPQLPPIFIGAPPSPWPDTDGNSTYYLDGDFILGGTGQKQAGMNTLFEELAGQTVYLPVFDRVYPVSYMINNPSTFPTPYVEDSSGPWPNPSSANNYLYHIVGFVAVELPDPPPAGNAKDVEGTLIQVGVGQGEINPTQPLQCDLRIHGVILWK
jgi:Flp pilus assembly protein TadG